MTIEALSKINEILSGVVNYEFLEWSSYPIQYPYWVGDYMEEVSETEDGLQVTTFTITGVTRNAWLELEECKQKIENSLPSRYILPSGNGLVIYYENAFQVPTDDIELKRMQINLQVKEWKVAN